MDNNLTKTFSVDKTPQEVFDAISDVRGWWSGDIEGRTDALGEEFSYRVPGIHYSKFTITEFEPASRISWLVTDSRLTFVEDEEEWTGTTVVFDISEESGRTTLRFTHQGLVPAVECFEICSVAWGDYILGSLQDLVTFGAGRPNPLDFDGEAALEVTRAQAEGR